MHLCGSAGHVRSHSLCRATRFVRDPAQRFVTRESAETIFRGLRTRKKITRTVFFLLSFLALSSSERTEFLQAIDYECKHNRCHSSDVWELCVTCVRRVKKRGDAVFYAKCLRQGLSRRKILTTVYRIHSNLTTRYREAMNYFMPEG